MTVFQLQRDLAEEVERILSDMVFKDPEGKPAHMKSYEQALPKREQRIYGEGQMPDQEIGVGNLMPEDNEVVDEDPYPYCVVRMESGEMHAGAQRSRVILVFGIFDDDLKNQGDKTLMNVLNRVSERFISNPVLKNMYSMNIENGINWILNDEDQYPYYFGGIEMEWDTFFIEREEDKYA